MDSVLVTGVGGPAGMAVLQSLRIAPEKLKILGVDMNPLAAGFFFSDERALVPRCSSPDYISRLLALCTRWKVNLIIPTVDEEVSTIARSSETFVKNGISVPIPSEASVELARDKLRIAELSRHGIDIPRTLAFVSAIGVRRAIRELGFPCVLKQRFGRGGRGFAIVEKEEDALYILQKRGKEELILQQYVEGDLLLAQGIAERGRLLVSIVHKRLAVKNEGSGTATAAVTVRDEASTARLKDVARLLDWTGAIGVEFIKDSKSEKRYLIDANPRICGQSHLSAVAGVNLAYYLVQLGRGRPLEVPGRYKTGLVFIRTWKDEVVPLKEVETLASSRTGTAVCLH
jgi:carbamoyl-phosphate synthase large subunit